MATSSVDAREVHERAIRRPLRILILAVIVLGVAAAIVGSRQMRQFIPIVYLPAAIAYVRPRWSQLLIWIMWSATWAMLALFMAIDTRPELFTVPSHWLLASSTALLVIALPLLRWFLSSRAPASAIPIARIHRRE
jgi:hypothetical protein